MRLRGFEKRASRREFLQAAGAGAAALSFGNVAAAMDNSHNTQSGGKPFLGIFPIGQTPVNPDNKLDLDGLASQVKFCNRGGAAGRPFPRKNEWMARKPLWRQAEAEKPHW